MAGSDLSLTRPADPTPPPSGVADRSTTSVSSLLFDTLDVCTSKPPIGHGQLLLHLYGNAQSLDTPVVVKQAKESEPLNESRVKSQPNSANTGQHRETAVSIGEWDDVDYDRHNDSWDDNIYDDSRFDTDVEPERRVGDVVNATVPREPVLDVVLPSVAVDTMASNKQNVVDQVPIVISDDLVDTNFIWKCWKYPREIGLALTT